MELLIKSPIIQFVEFLSSWVFHLLHPDPHSNIEMAIRGPCVMAALIVILAITVVQAELTRDEPQQGPASSEVTARQRGPFHSSSKYPTIDEAAAFNNVITFLPTYFTQFIPLAGAGVLLHS